MGINLTVSKMRYLFSFIFCLSSILARAGVMGAQSEQGSMPRRILDLGLIFCSHCLKIINILLWICVLKVNSSGAMEPALGAWNLGLRHPFHGSPPTFHFPWGWVFQCLLLCHLAFHVTFDRPPSCHLVTTVHSWHGAGHRYRESQG